MRDVNLSKFKPQPLAPFFGHVSSSPQGDAVGFSLVHVESGKYFCRGADVDTTDHYSGDILRNATAAPAGGIVVQYFAVPEGARGDKAKPRLVAQTKTDENGQHEVCLPTGQYFYRYLLKSGLPIKRRDVDAETLARLADRSLVHFHATVEPQRSVVWQRPALEHESGLQSNDSLALATGPTIAEVRDVGLIWHDLVCAWDGSDGTPLPWHDVENVLVEVGAQLRAAKSELRFITFDKNFARPDLLSSLMMRGLPVFPGTLNDLQLATAYKNFEALAAAGCVRVVKHKKTWHQLANTVQIVQGKRADAGAGEYKNLSDALVQAIYYAAQASAMETTSAGAEFFKPLRPSPSDARGVIPQSADIAVSRVLRAFNPEPPRALPRVPRYVLFGAEE